MDYGKVLGRAWEITWRWKVLWILGFLAALGSGSSAGNPSYTVDSSDWGYTFTHRIPPEIIGIIAAVTCGAILFVIALWVISIIARGGLIAGVNQVEEEKATSFGRAWRAGASRFWTLFGISILTGLPVFILVVGGSIVLVLMFVGSGLALDSSGPGGAMGLVTSILCSGGFCCGMIVLAIILAQIRLYAERAAILEGLGWIEAVKRGWQVLRENLGPTIIFWLIFFALGLVFGGVIIAILFAAFIPLVPLFGNLDWGPWVIAPFCFGGLLVALVGALINSIVTTFSSATWTLAYREMTGRVAQPDVEVTVEPIAE